MSRSPAHGQLPPDVAERVRAYLAAFLPAGEVDDAVSEVAADTRYWGDTDQGQILAVAHTVLTSRLRIAVDVEVLVLNEDVGLTVPEIAEVLGLAPTEVRRILDEALAVVAEPEPAPAPAVVPEPVPISTAEPAAAAPAVPAGPEEHVPPRAGSRRRATLLVAAALAVAVVAVLAAWVVGRDDGCPPGASVCVTDSVLTAEVDATTGVPGEDRDVFSLEEPVRLWFRFDRRELDVRPLEVRWYRDGAILYETEVRVGAGSELNVPFVALWADQPGRYRVEVAEDDRVLLTRDFRIES